MKHEEIEQVAKVAAELYGRDWETLAEYSRIVWREMVRHEPQPGVVPSEMDKCVAKAKQYWLDGQEGQRQAVETPAPVEKKSKNKR